MTVVVPEAAFNSGVLDGVRHMHLLADLEYYAERAGVDPHYIWTPAASQLTKEEISYLRRCLVLAKTENVSGLVYTCPGDVTKRFAVMCAALLRAFVDARLMTAQQVVESVKSTGGPEATVLFIPNFYSAMEIGKFDNARVAALGDVLCNRAALGLQTVIHVADVKSVKDKLGGRVASILETMRHAGG